MPGFCPAKAGPAATGPLALRQGRPTRPPENDREDGDDEFLAGLLIRMWALASGRTLRSDVRPEQLGREELIRFWADDLTPASGRHADAAVGETAGETRAMR